MIKISRLQFYLIAFLIVLLPLSSSWKILLFGKKTTGLVIANSGYYLPDNIAGTRVYENASIIRYYVGNEYYEFLGPDEVEYPEGKKFTIIYNEKKPDKFIMLSFAGLFLTSKTIIPAAMLIIWAAFYSVYKHSKKTSDPHSRLELYKQKLRLKRKF